MVRSTLVSSKVEVFRLASEINGVMKRSKVYKADCRATINRAKSLTGRDMAGYERIHNSLY